jgi:hypothetical protein
MSYLLAVAAVVVAAPLAAAVLVTVASLREDASKSLAGRPPGLLTAAARRLLSLRTSGSASQRGPAGPPPADGPADGPADEVPPPPSGSADSTLMMPRS